MRKLLVVVVLLVGLGVAGYLGMGYIAKSAIQTVGSRVLLTQVEVGSVNIQPLQGKVTISGLKVYNPEGFQSPTAIEIGTAEINASFSALRANPMKIDAILIEEPVLNFELGINGNNLYTLQKNASFSLGSSESNSEAKEKNVVIAVLQITKPKLKVVPPVSTEGVQALELPMTDIIIKNIGSESKPAEMGAVLTEVLAKVIASLPVIDGGMVRDAAQQAEGAVEGAVEGAAEAVDGAVKGLLVQ
jgi:hypothetical protein